MQRGTYVIALSDEAVEGGLLARGDAQPAFAQSVLWAAAQGTEGAGGVAGNGAAPLATFLAQAGWERGLAMLVLPTEHVSFRHLHFEFSDAKKIRQVLPFELAEELLDDIEHYAYDLEIVPQENGGADVHVYLYDKSQIDLAAETLEAHHLLLQRATFSAQALLQAHSPAEGNHLYVYVGSEEAFVAHASDGQLHSTQSIAPHPGGVLADLKALGPGSPHDQLQELFRAPAEDERRGALRDTLRERLEWVRDEVNRFLRIGALREPLTVSLHGLFGELFEWSAGAPAITLRFPQGAWPGARRTHFGVLDELLRQPRGIPGRGLNFYRRVGTWVALARDLRWPLVAAGVLLALLATLGGTSYVMRANALDARLNAVNRDLREALKLTGQVAAVNVNASLSGLQERLDRLRKERQASAYIESYNYEMLKLLSELSQAVRQQSGVTVDALSFNQERFTLSGSTPNYVDAETLRTRIEALPRFAERSVKVTNSNVGQTIRYRLTVER